MARSITDARQVTLRAFLQQIANAASYAGTADSKPANQSELDNLLSSLNSEVTPLLRMSASSTPNLVVTIGAGKLTNSESSYTRAIPHVGTAYVQFAAGTLTFPASSGGNIVGSPGNSSVLTLGVGNYAAVLVYLDGNGNLNTIVGAEDAVEATAITNLPPSPDSTLPIGYVVVHNTAGVIDAIAQTKISQFGTGAGGGGTGDASLAEVALRDRFAQSGFKYLDPNVFKRDKVTKIDGASTGAFDLVKSAFKFTSIGQTYVSTNLANAEFLAEGVDLTEIELEVYWLLSFIDSAAVYEASRDGGTNWTTLTMARVGTDSNAFRAYKVFADESVQQSVVTVAPTGVGSALNATTQQELSSRLILSSTTVVRSIDLNLNYGGVGTGTFSVRIVRDSAGSPSTALADLISESNAVTISTANLGTGNVTKTVNIPQAVLTAGTYHIVLVTDAAYKAGTLDLSWRSGAGTNGANYNGTTWTAGQASKAFVQKGRVHDLRIRITGSATNRYIEAIGTSFGVDDGILAPNGSKNVQRFYFTGDENRTQFTLNWTPDPDIFEMYDVYRGQVYVIDNDTVRLSGQTVTFDPDTFNFPGESILLIARQIKGIGIDNSDSNAAAISTQSTNLIDVGNQISELEFVTIPKIAVPFTTIINRAYIPNLSQDLGSRLGIERIMTQSLIPLQNEFGSNGEPVFTTLNDRLGQIRLIGQFLATNATSGIGLQTDTTTADSNFVEITFYGTGLNILDAGYTAAGYENYSVTVNGTPYPSLTNPATISTILNSRNYSQNRVRSIVSNLTLGIYTVRLGLGRSVIHGFEVLNESSTIKVNPGSQYVSGKKLTSASQQSLVHNTTFESGTLGTKGGRVLVYQKSDGTIAKAVNPTDSLQLNLTSANHANEEISRVYHWREFGASKTDDFSSLTGAASSRAFTLDDGTTTLIGQNVSVGAGTGYGEGLGLSSTIGESLTLSFIGTGLDLTNVRNTAIVGSYSIFVDGIPIATNIAGSTLFGDGKGNTVKIVSGLPYGTHTMRITITATIGNGLNIGRFIVYQPKTPTLPVGAKAIGAYNLMADFVANTTAGISTISTGTMRKYATREFTYVNGTGGTSDWVFIGGVNPVNNICGFEVSSNRLNSYLEYTFLGVGFDFRFMGDTNSSNNITVTIDGLTFNTANYPSQSAAATVYGGGITFTAATGILDQQATVSVTPGCGFVVTGLAQGKHTVRFNNGTASLKIENECMDIITPIHSQKSNIYADFQNTLSIGSQGIEDLRKISSLEQITSQKAWAQAVGLFSSPTSASTVFVPVPDMSVSVKTNTGVLEISYSIAKSSNTLGAQTTLQIYVDGIAVGTPQLNQHPGSGVTTASDTMRIPISAGVHKVDLYWMQNTGTGTAQGVSRSLLVREL